jgi:uncharacterized membrane protein YphA (DoxX/SURF4 family)
VNQALWIVAIVLAAIFAGSGLMKLLVPKDKLLSSGQGWAQDYTPTNIRLIGVVELLGAAGLIVPAVTHIAPILVPLAAVGLAFVMVGAASLHARRKEAMNIGSMPYFFAGRVRGMGQVRTVPVCLTLLGSRKP